METTREMGEQIQEFKDKLVKNEVRFDNTGIWRVNSLENNKDIQKAGFAIPENRIGYDEWNVGREVAEAKLIQLGQASITTRQKFKGATKGTSPASVYLRKKFPQKLPFPILMPTATIFKWRTTRTIGAVLGRGVPYLGWGLLVWDAVDLTIGAVNYFNTPSDNSKENETKKDGK